MNLQEIKAALSDAENASGISVDLRIDISGAITELMDAVEIVEGEEENVALAELEELEKRLSEIPDAVDEPEGELNALDAVLEQVVSGEKSEADLKKEADALFLATQDDIVVPDPEPNPDTETIKVDQTSEAAFSIEQVDVRGEEKAVKLQEKALDEGFMMAGNTVSYVGNPKKVKGYISITAESKDSKHHWSRTKLKISRGDIEIPFIDGAAMKDDEFYDSDLLINGVFFDMNPPENPEYTFEWFHKDDLEAALIPSENSQIAIEVTNKVEVYKP